MLRDEEGYLPFEPFETEMQKAAELITKIYLAKDYYVMELFIHQNNHHQCLCHICQTLMNFLLVS